MNTYIVSSYIHLTTFTSHVNHTYKTNNSEKTLASYIRVDVFINSHMNTYSRASKP